ncbi:PREDICTED: uncharacterized protein LOC105949467 [Erythranthe guttata]|uniref:uncharacterized protein LOC105949467 n=1 Tax=Erythranthe guttata TaxID=4155 RepID=UPI00064D863C|nr:PREDICTED: uncharacterized protein LOC105949467 [Erythranthe guttata]|eukprot:XP_012828234.1 PREDICTED: uncharacterized protein LOC105949467 [Erythranthe guttata]
MSARSPDPFGQKVPSGEGGENPAFSISSSSEEGPYFSPSGKLLERPKKRGRKEISSSARSGSPSLSEGRDLDDQWGPSTLSETDLTNLVRDIGLPTDVELILPSRDDRPLNPPLGFSTWFSEQFYFGLSFPISPWFSEIAQLCNVSLNQFHPHAIIIMTGFRMLCAWSGVIPTPARFRSVMVLKNSSPFHVSISARPGFKILMPPNKTDGWQGHYFFARNPVDTPYLCPWLATLPEKRRGKPLAVDECVLKMISHFQPSHGVPDSLTSFPPMLRHFRFHDNGTYSLTREDLGGFGYNTNYYFDSLSYFDLRMKRMFRGDKPATRPSEPEPGFEASEFQRPLIAESEKRSSEEGALRPRPSKKNAAPPRARGGPPSRTEDSEPPKRSSAIVLASSPPPSSTEEVVEREPAPKKRRSELALGAAGSSLPAGFGLHLCQNAENAIAACRSLAFPTDVAHFGQMSKGDRLELLLHNITQQFAIAFSGPLGWDDVSREAYDNQKKEVTQLRKEVRGLKESLAMSESSKEGLFAEVKRLQEREKILQAEKDSLGSHVTSLEEKAKGLSNELYAAGVQASTNFAEGVKEGQRLFPGSPEGLRFIEEFVRRFFHRLWRSTTFTREASGLARFFFSSAVAAVRKRLCGAGIEFPLVESELAEDLPDDVIPGFEGDVNEDPNLEWWRPVYQGLVEEFTRQGAITDFVGDIGALGMVVSSEEAQPSLVSPTPPDAENRSEADAAVPK